jgi:putative membrane protein
MRKAMLKTLRTTYVLTTITGLGLINLHAADPSTSVGSTPTYGTTTQSSSADHSSKSFIKEALKDNQTEIDLGSLGAEKAQNADLKKFCQQIQKDHTQANQELQPLATKYGISTETSKPHEVTKFEKETAGAEFDKKLATEMLKSHQKDISKFEKAASKVQEADVKQYAESMLPKLREHLQHAATVAGSVGVDQSTISSVMSKTPSVGGTSESQETTSGKASSSKTDQGAGSRDLQPTTPRDK